MVKTGTNYPRVIIAGLRGGSGKTTVALGLVGAIAKKHKVVPFKKGPDYIDAGWLSAAANSPCYNLDPYMIGNEQVLRSFLKRARGGIAIIEGNRGLYDGMDVKGSYSTAELAKLLKAPVILVIDCTKITRTASALLMGAMVFDSEVNIKGVILNQVSNTRHQRITTECIEHYCKVPVLGVLPRLRETELPERHMGLVPIYEYSIVEEAIDQLSERAMRHFNIDRIMEIATSAEKLKVSQDLTDEAVITSSDRVVKVGIIRDEAFQFYYPENLEELQKAGAELVYISALKDTRLPDIDCLYIGGGFPETNAIGLADNVGFRHSLKEAIESGMPVYAECGGLMFLGKTLRVNDKTYEMAGVFPFSFVMKDRPEAHGYTEAEVIGTNPFYPKGTILRGHEFHYSSICKGTEGVEFALSMRRGKGIINGNDGAIYKNCMALYTHIHSLGCSHWTVAMIKKAEEFKYAKTIRT